MHINYFQLYPNNIINNFREMQRLYTIFYLIEAWGANHRAWGSFNKFLYKKKKYLDLVVQTTSLLYLLIHHLLHLSDKISQ